MIGGNLRTLLRLTTELWLVPKWPVIHKDQSYFFLDMNHIPVLDEQESIDNVFGW